MRGRPLLVVVGPTASGKTELVEQLAASIPIEAVAADHSVGMGKVAQPLRVAVSGTAVSPPIHDTLLILGKPKTLARIDRCLGRRADGTK